MQELINLCNVLAVTVCAAAIIGVLYSVGLRLRWNGPNGTLSTSVASRAASVACFGACIAILVFALVLLVVA